MHYPYAEARILHLYGNLHASRGDTGAEGERCLRDAWAIFQRLGAGSDAARVERDLK
jgi:hypothetical protein